MHEKIIEAVHAAAGEVFSTMIGMPLQLADNPGGQAAPHGGVLAVIGLAGPWVGTGAVCCTASVARKVASALLMTEFESVDREVLDAIAEICNMIIGNVKAALEPEVGTLGLSTPTVIYGEDFVARSLPVSERTVVPLLCEGERFDVIVELRPNTGAGRSAAMATVGGNHTAR